MLSRQIVRVVSLSIVILLLASCGKGNDQEPIAEVISNDATSTSAVSLSQDTDDELIIKPTPSGEVPTAVPPPESSFDSDGDGFMTEEELRKALNARIPDFKFPDGYTLSADRLITLTTTELPDDTEYENGYEYTMIGFPHMCAWIQTWLSAQAGGDTVLQEEAMDQLMTETLTNPSFIYIVDDYKVIFETAQIGDIAPLQNLLNTPQCNWDLFDATPEAKQHTPPFSKSMTAHLTPLSACVH